jgi:hypothetical protein
MFQTNYVGGQPQFPCTARKLGRGFDLEVHLQETAVAGILARCLSPSIAVIGTLASLTLTGLLAWAAIRLTHLSGITDDSSLNLGLS